MKFFCVKCEKECKDYICKCGATCRIRFSDTIESKDYGVVYSHFNGVPAVNLNRLQESDRVLIRKMTKLGMVRVEGELAVKNDHPLWNMFFIYYVQAIGL